MTFLEGAEKRPLEILTFFLRIGMWFLKGRRVLQQQVFFAYFGYRVEFVECNNESHLPRRNIHRHFAQSVLHPAYFTPTFCEPADILPFFCFVESSVF
jgi:hypothetical protein